MANAVRARSKRATAEEVWRLMAGFTIGNVQRGDHLSMLREHGLTPGHLKALGLLDPDEPRPMGALADGLQCDASQVTWLVDRLEERGFVERRPHATDRRIKTIALTDAGVEFRARLFDQLHKPPADLLALDASTLEALRAQLAQLPPPNEGFWAGFAGR